MSKSLKNDQTSTGEKAADMFEKTTILSLKGVTSALESDLSLLVKILFETMRTCKSSYRVCSPLKVALQSKIHFFQTDNGFVRKARKPMKSDRKRSNLKR